MKAGRLWGVQHLAHQFFDDWLAGQKPEIVEVQQHRMELPRGDMVIARNQEPDDSNERDYALARECKLPVNRRLTECPLDDRRMTAVCISCC